MRVLMIGGTRFIGRAITGAFAARGDEVTVVHRGETEPDGLAPCQHLHADRREFASLAAQVRALEPDVVVDTLAMTAADTEAVLPHLPDTRLIVLSSVDTYRAYGNLLAERGGEPLPVTEDSPVRDEHYPYRGQMGGRYEDYDKLDVEPAYLARGGTVLRLGYIYGEHDPQRREEPILRRVRAGRGRIPIGAGTWLMSRCYVGDVAGAVLAAAGTEAAAGQVLNVVETASVTVADWSRQILAAAGHQAGLVTVPDADVPDDLEETRNFAQHMLVSNAKARALLDWRPADPEVSVVASVRWHLDHPPAGADPDFGPDDRALPV